MFLQKPMLGTQLDRSDSLNNPVLDLIFNEGHGNIVHDLSGCGNHGTLHGFDFPPTKTSGWNPGMDGVALVFDGSDDHILMPDSPSLDRHPAVTVEALIKLDSYGSGDGGNIFSIGDSDQYRFRVQSSNGHGWFLINDSSGLDVLQSTSIVPLHRWKRMIVVCESANYMKMYIDGLLSGYIPTTHSIAAVCGNLHIGQSSAGDEFFNGAIARLRILPRVMSAFEVMQHQIDPYGVYR